MSKNVEDISRFLLGRLPVLFGIGLIENAYDHTMDIVGVPARELPDREPALLERAKRNMPRICVPDMDVLIVDRIGKNFSGSGMDPNVTGRFYSKAVPAVPAAQRITVLGLSNETHGNAPSGGAFGSRKHVYQQPDLPGSGIQPYPHVF